MADETERVAVSDLEELIEQLPGVLRCQVVTNDWGGIEAVHVLSSLDRSPKQTVRDIESALMARWHLRVDHKKISVAQVATQRPQAGDRRRIRVAGWEMEHDAARGRVTATVLLADEGDAVLRGEYRGAYIPSQQPLPMALAAVEALNRLPGEQAFALVELREVTVGGRPVFLVAVSHLGPNQQEELLIGTAVAGPDRAATAVRAVLDAVNRRLGRVAGGHAAVTAPGTGTGDDGDEDKEE